MNTKRMLVIEKLIINIPDELQSKDGRVEISIDEALEWYLNYRKTQLAALENNFGNFTYFFANLPAGMYPDKPETMNTEKLAEYLAHHKSQCSAGMMASIIYDEELKAYRNCYTEDEMVQYEAKMKVLRKMREKDKQSDKISNDKCPTDCYNICDENCPKDDKKGEAMQ